MNSVDRVRHFNRFYTKQIGVLGEGLLNSPFSLTEARVLYELAQAEALTASALCDELNIDRGYLSRILAAFERCKLVRRKRSAHDGRQSHLSLTAAGRRAFTKLNDASRNDVQRTLSSLTAAEREELIRSMHKIERVFGEAPQDKPAFKLRSFRPGDMGWIVHRHGVLYSREYGWDETFEALVAEIAANFIRNLDPARERCWIAEMDGDLAGCVFLVRHPSRKDVARLRLLLVEPSARGHGIGRRLVGECTKFARRSGYRKITLWTNSVLHSARKIYEGEGYGLVEETPHHSFGHDLIGQTWELDLISERAGAAS